MTQQTGDGFLFHLSSDVHLPVRMRITTLEGNFAKISSDLSAMCGIYSADAWNISSLYLTLQLWNGGHLVGVPYTSTFSSLIGSTIQWNEVIQLPILYSDLPRDVQLAITIHHCVGPAAKIPLGGTTISLFTRKGTLVQGRYRLLVSLGRPADGSDPTTTPGLSNTSRMAQIEKTMKKFDSHKIQRIDWLDKLVGRSIGELHNEGDSNDELFLDVTFPDFGHPIVFFSKQPIGVSAPIPTSSMSQVYDPDFGRTNPFEEKHFMLSRARRGDQFADRELKPNAEERRTLEAVMMYPPSRRLTPDDKDILWRFRYYLRSYKKALPKFLKAVDWTKPSEEKEALKLMEQWEPIDTVDALGLLSFQFKENASVRSYAVKRLHKTPDTELQYYLLQLVQALMYDKKEATSDLSQFLLLRAIESPKIGCQLYWYFIVEQKSKLYRRILKDFKKSLSRIPNGKMLLRLFKTQSDILNTLTEVSRRLQESGLSRDRKVEVAKTWLSVNGDYNILNKFEPTLLPIDGDYVMFGVKPEISVFQSSQQPLKITFNITTSHYNSNEYAVIFKTGDDLRQDQLVVQLISLMDRLLKAEHLDLSLVTYKVIATSPSDGMVEMVNDSKNVADILDEYGGQIQSFLRKHNPDEHGPYGIDPAAFDRFLRSSAGYCVITYILGVGDRHLDNLLMTKRGELFHIDYGYILGKDPKPFPPPMKLSPPMVEAMGGLTSEHYFKFKTYCCTAYNILRKSSHLILNLISLMIDSGIEQLSFGEQSILRVQEKFKLDLTDEQANEVFQQLIYDSVRALAPKVSEAIHRWYKYWQK